MDRSAFVFKHILNHMSMQPIPFDDLTPREREVLLLESEYYELHELAEALGKKGDDTHAVMRGEDDDLSKACTENVTKMCQ